MRSATSGRSVFPYPSRVTPNVVADLTGAVLRAKRFVHKRAHTERVITQCHRFRSYYPFIKKLSPPSAIARMRKHSDARLVRARSRPRPAAGLVDTGPRRTARRRDVVSGRWRRYGLTMALLFSAASVRTASSASNAARPRCRCLRTPIVFKWPDYFHRPFKRIIGRVRVLRPPIRVHGPGRTAAYGKRGPSLYRFPTRKNNNKTKIKKTNCWFNTTTSAVLARFANRLRRDPRASRDDVSSIARLAKLNRTAQSGRVATVLGCTSKAYDWKRGGFPTFFFFFSTERP